MRAKIAEHPTEDFVAIAASGGATISDPVSITVAPTPTNFVHRFIHLRPRITRDFLTVAGIAGNRITVDQDTTRSDQRTDSFGDGADLRAYRIIGDALVLVGETTITKWHARKWNRESNDYIPAGTSEYRYRFNNYNRPSVTQYFGVCAMDASGNLGPIAWGSMTCGDWVTDRPAEPSNTINTDVSTDSSSIDGGGPAAPAGVSVVSESDGWIAAVSWTDTPGAHGHAVFRCDYDPSDLLNSTLDLSDASFIQTSDILLVDKVFPILATPDDERAAQVTSRVWNAESEAPAAERNWGSQRYTTNSEHDDPVEGWYRRHVWDGVTGPDYGHGAQVYTHSGTSQEWYHILEAGQEYAIECRAKGSGTMRLYAHNALDPAGTTDTQEDFTLTSEWQTFSHRFTPISTQTSDTPRSIQAYLTGAGTLDITWLVLRQTHTPLGEVSAATVTKAAGVKLVRDHENIKSRPWSHTFSDLVSGDQAKLVRYLRFCDDIGASPWFQFEWIFTDAEWAAVAEYILAPYDPETDTPGAKPWAYRRYATLGWQEPIIDRFAEIMFEIGNENWNSLRSFYTMPSVSGESAGTVNGKWLDYVANKIEASPYWLPAHATKWRNYLGGWSTQIESDWSHDSAYASEKADLIGPADYNGVSWDNNATQTADPEDPAAWQYTTANSLLPLNAAANRADKAQKFKALCDAASVGRDKPLRPAIYEAGPGYMLDGLNGADVNEEQSAAQEYVMKSAGAGTATFDAFLINAANGNVLNNFFTFDAGRDWTTHATETNGGAINPPWMWTQWLNQTFPTGFAVTDYSGFVRPYEDFDASALKAGVSVTGANPVGVFRIDGGGKIALAALNRSPLNSYAIDVAVAGVAGRLLSLVAMDGVGTTVDVPTGDDIATRRSIVIPDGYKAVNNTAASAGNVTLTTTPQTFTDHAAATIPPGLARVWVWE